jgi:proteasome alpha subunit
MLTPYDWQEGIGNRASYVESKLEQGAPVLALSLEAGILLFSYRRQAQKIYELYDRLIFGALGQQSDVEALRSAAVEFAHQEGYNRSEEDVTIQRLATAMSAPLKRSFADFSTVPLIARSVFGEVNETHADDLYYVLDYDGEFQIGRYRAVVAGTDAVRQSLEAKLEGVAPSTTPEEALTQLRAIWLSGIKEGGDERADDVILEGLTVEAVLLSRSSERENRFRVLSEAR